MDLGPPCEQLKRQQVAAVQLGAVGRERIDLTFGIETPQ